MKIILRFTLIELLLVVGLMALMMGIALPAFSKMAKGNGVTVAARDISAKINGARTFAVTYRKHVALIFPTAMDDSNIPDQLRYTQFRAAIVEANSSSGYDWKAWIDGETWVKMPSGVILGGTASPSAWTSSSCGYENCSEISVVDYSDVKGASCVKTAKTCLVFRPNGMLLNGAGSFGMGIWEGSVTTLNGTSTTVQSTNSANYVKLYVNPFTARISYTNM